MMFNDRNRPERVYLDCLPAFSRVKLGTTKVGLLVFVASPKSAVQHPAKGGVISFPNLLFVLYCSRLRIDIIVL